MNFNIDSKNDEMIMKLIHYFITEENYTPIVVHGVKDEVWLENLDAPYRIIRINSNYIHNDEQLEADIFKTKRVIDQIKKKTYSISMDTLNIFSNISENVDINKNVKNISSINIKGLDDILKNKNILELYPNIKSKLIQDKEGLDLIVNVTNDINKKTIKDNAMFTKIFEPKKPIITPILIGICVIVFALMYIIGIGIHEFSGYTITQYLLGNVTNLFLEMWGANSQTLVKAGEVYRLFTSMFIHIGIIHLFVNMNALNIIGKQVENFLGRIKYLIVFIGSGIVGSLFSVVMNTNPSAGASGAIFGLLGSLLYFGYHYRLYLATVLRTQIIPVILINLAIGFLIPGIDNFAHIGGLIGGYLITMIVGIPGKTKKNERINGIIVLTLLIGFLVYMLVR